MGVFQTVQVAARRGSIYGCTAVHGIGRAKDVICVGSHSILYEKKLSWGVEHAASIEFRDNTTDVFRNNAEVGRAIGK